jgi:hypothetical protein
MSEDALQILLGLEAERRDRVAFLSLDVIANACEADPLSRRETFER